MTTNNKKRKKKITKKEMIKKRVYDIVNNALIVAIVILVGFFVYSGIENVFGKDNLNKLNEFQYEKKVFLQDSYLLDYLNENQIEKQKIVDIYKNNESIVLIYKK